MAKRKSPDEMPQNDAMNAVINATTEEVSVDKTAEDATAQDQTPDTEGDKTAPTDTSDTLSDATTNDVTGDTPDETDVTDSTPEPEKSAQLAPAPVQPEPQRSIALPLIFGGVIAAMVGFIAARAEVLDPLSPPSMRTTAPDTALANDLDSATDRLAELEAAVANLPDPQAPAAGTPVDLDPVMTQIDELGVRVETLSGLSDRIDMLSAAVDALAARPAPSGEVTIPTETIDAALADLRATAQTQQDEIDQLLADARLVKDDAEAAATATLVRAALTRIMSAVDTGAPFNTALGDLEQAGTSDIPEVLRAAATDGVIPLADLQAAAPDAARSALAAARAADTDGGLVTFFQRQLGARSVEPREGSDPDAVLSRIEAAVRAGRIGDALAEAQTLPDPARDALGPWLEQAQSRHDAVTAANALAERLSAL